jgi:6-phosphogluconolactonase/glucosamine-6-phosphate isomerase/deaminase
MHHELTSLPSPDAVAQAGAEFVAERVRAAVADRGIFNFAVSGGHTPWAMFAALASLEVPWDADLAEAAAAYATDLPDQFDLVHLGLGDDGHTASLVPGDPVLSVTDRLVAVTGPYQGHPRMTLTYPALGRARQLLWLVTGADKKAPLSSLVAGDTAIPAGRVQAAASLILADQAAAGA